jgi:hypothetical protein
MNEDETTNLLDNNSDEFVSNDIDEFLQATNQ